METQNVKLDSLIAADYNPRKRLGQGDCEYEAIKQSLQAYGFVQPIVVNVRNSRIVSGHQRCLIARDMGLDTVPAVYVDLNDEDEIRLCLILNKLTGKWDKAKLTRIVSNCKTMPGQLSMFELGGFSEEEVAALMTQSAPIDIFEPKPKTSNANNKNCPKCGFIF